MTRGRVSMTVPQYQRRECSVDGATVRLSPMECELAVLLLVAGPDGAVAYDTLVEALWPDPDLQPLGAVRIIHCCMDRLRKRGIRVEVEWGRGPFIGGYARGDRYRLLMRRPRERCPACRQRLAA